MSKAKVPVVILVRVSTVKQETQRQISELQAYADCKGYEVVEICRETVSGRAADDDRHGLRHVEALAQLGKVKKVLVHEISRLARRNSVAHRFVETLEECGVSLYWHAQGIETLLANGKRNPAAGIMLALLSEMARSELETLRDRINSGLAEARRKGVKLGNVAQPLRAALTGRSTSPPIFDVLAVLGKSETLARLGDQSAHGSNVN